MVETPVIDMHSHASRGALSAINEYQDRFTRIMDAAGVDRVCVSRLSHGEAFACNDAVARFVSRRPDRFIGVAFVTPLYPNEAIMELERAFGELGMKMLKLYPDYVGYPIDDPRYSPIFEWCDARDIVVKSHTSYTSERDTLTAPRRSIGLAERFSNIRWVLAHSGNSPQGQRQAIEAAQASPNVFLETATSFGDHGTVERLVEGAGEDRVLYGSDMMLMDARLQVGRIVTADISEEAKRKVLGLNAARLLGL